VKGKWFHARQLARLGPWLLAVASERLYRDLGYRGFDAYARERLGMVPSKARALLRLERLAQFAPALGEAWRAGSLSWTQAEALAPLLRLGAARPWQAAWVARARGVSVRRLREDVDWAISTENLDPAALPPLPAGLQTGARPRASGARDRLFFTAPPLVSYASGDLVLEINSRTTSAMTWAPRTMSASAVSSATS
jgi:hypothetical protein